MRQDCDILSHQFCGQHVGGTSTHVVLWCERNLDTPKNKEYTPYKIYYSVQCFKNNTQKDKLSKNEVIIKP